MATATLRPDRPLRALSFFIGQARVIPEPIRIPGLLALPARGPLRDVLLDVESATAAVGDFADAATVIPPPVEKMEDG